MSASREVVRRLRAWQAGKPLPRGATRHIALARSADILILAFVRMGGESRPWGVAFGHPGSPPRILTVAEARDRDLVADMAAELAPALLAHLRCPGHAHPAPTDAEGLAPLRQVWVPNPSHVEMLHHLAYAYTFTRFDGPHQQLLQAFGRACGWLFREAQRPGQQHAMAATAALRTAYTFPAEDTRQGHLGYLLAWLGTSGGRDARLAAAVEAEKESISTSLDPLVERSLEGALERYREAVRAEDDRAVHQEAASVRADLSPELERRFALTEEAITELRADSRRENTGVARLVTDGLQEQWFGHTRAELRFNSPDQGPAFVPSVETDRFPAAAGSRYQIQQASAELAKSVLLHDDIELLAEAIADGDAFRGRISAVANEGVGRAVCPVWTVHEPTGRPLRLRIGGDICAVGHHNRRGRIRDVTRAPDGGSLIEVEITNGKTATRGATGQAAIAPVDGRWVGLEVAFANAPADGISRRKASRVWERGAPGAWLTHAAPGGARARIDAEDSDTESTPLPTSEGRP